jgi:hypothetical protein
MLIDPEIFASLVSVCRLAQSAGSNRYCDAILNRLAAETMARAEAAEQAEERSLHEMHEKGDTCPF